MSDRPRAIPRTEFSPAWLARYDFVDDDGKASTLKELCTTVPPAVAPTPAQFPRSIMFSRLTVSIRDFGTDDIVYIEDDDRLPHEIARWYKHFYKHVCLMSDEAIDKRLECILLLGLRWDRYTCTWVPKLAVQRPEPVFEG